MSLADYSLVELSASIDLSTFDCGDQDINEFLKDDALNYQKDRMANTYLFIDDDSNEIVAFFSISNDCLNDLGEDSGYTNKIWNKFHRKAEIPNKKRIRSYPAIKIGRLGVCKKLQGNGLAYELMDFIKGYSVLNLKPACRLLLVDAYNKEKQIKFYSRNGFLFLLDSDEHDEKRIMYYNLQRLED